MTSTEPTIKRVVYGALVTLSGVALLVSYPTSRDEPATAAVATDSDSSGANASAPTSADGDTSEGSATGSATPDSTEPTSSASAPATSSGLADGTYTGASTSTRWGDVQVQITVSGGVITDAQAVDYPSENGRDQQINSYAIPILNSEATGTTDGSIDMVSGATVTSRGYIGSLQDAIDQAMGR